MSGTGLFLGRSKKVEVLRGGSRVALRVTGRRTTRPGWLAGRPVAVKTAEGVESVSPD